MIHERESTKCIIGVANVANNSHVLLPGSHVVRLRISAKETDPTVASISLVLDGKYSTDAATMLREHAIMKIGKVKVSRRRMIKRATSAVLGSALLGTVIKLAYDRYETTHSVPAPKSTPVAERAPTPPSAPVPHAPAPVAPSVPAPPKHRPVGSKREPPATYDLRGAHFDGPARIGGAESININGDINGPAQIGGRGNKMYLGRPPRQLTDELAKKLLRAIPKSKRLSVGVVSHDDDLYAGQIRDFLVSQGYSVAKPINFVLTSDTTTQGLLLDDKSDSDDWSITVFPDR